MYPTQDWQNALGSITKSLDKLQKQCDALKAEMVRAEQQGDASPLERLMQAQKKKSAQKPPITGHTLSTADGYTKNHYIKGLAMVLQCCDRVESAQISLLKQLLQGCKCDYSLETYLRHGQTYEPEDYETLMEILKEKKLEQFFFYDALLLTHMGPPSDSVMEFLGMLGEDLGLSTAAVKDFAQLCKHYLTRGKFKPELKNVSCAIVAHPYCAVAGLKTPEVVEVYLPEKGPILLKKTEYREQNVIFKNLIIDMNDYDKALWRFSDCPMVHFEDCIFKNAVESIRFWRCENINVTRCTFEKFSSAVFNMQRCNTRVIQDSVFTGCMRVHASTSPDVVRKSMIFDEIACLKPVELYRTIFEGCGGENTMVGRCKTIVGGKHPMVVSQCTFKNCWHYNKYSINANQTFKQKDGCTLFDTAVINDGNKVINSVPFN